MSFKPYYSALGITSKIDEAVERALDEIEKDEQRYRLEKKIQIMMAQTREEKRQMPEFPLVCSRECVFTQCSSWNNPLAVGNPCRNRVLTNEQIEKSPQDPNDVTRGISKYFPPQPREEPTIIISEDEFRTMRKGVLKKGWDIL
jgi:hypothetical protein